MGGHGRTRVVNGFGFKKAAVGGGKRIAVVTNGMALRGVILSVRLVIVGAASMERLLRPRGRSAGRGAVNATVPEKKRLGTVERVVGAASTEGLLRPRGRSAGR